MRHRMARAAAHARRSGVVLLEVLVALTILAVAGVSLAVLATESADAVRRAQAVSFETEHASAFLDAVVLWPRADLDRHLGDRFEGPWRLTIERPLPTLYTVSLADSGTHRELLRTALFRPETRDAQP